MRVTSANSAMLVFVLVLVLGIVSMRATAQQQAASPRPDESGVVRTVQVFHILVPEQATASTLLREIRSVPAHAQLEKFKEVARRTSQDPGSAAAGGDLGTIHEGLMNLTFEAAIFKAQPDDVTEPFRTEFGWHLVYVTRRGEWSVADICRSSLEKSAVAAETRDWEGVALALKPLSQGTLEARVSSLLGVEWRGPFVSKNGDPAYVRSGAAPHDESVSRRIVTLHTEFVRAKFVAALPIACSRSRQEQWVVDCRPPGAIGWASTVEFEGRAGTGRRTMQFGVGLAGAKLERLQAGTEKSWLYDMACIPPAPSRPMT